MPGSNNSDVAFEEFDEAIRANPTAVLRARYERDAFARALLPLPEVVEVIPSGSLARGTPVGPIHDVDLIVVFEAGSQPHWGGGSGTAAAALDHMQGLILERLQAGKIQRTEPRNHVVKCETDITLGLIEELLGGVLPPAAPPVDVMPAIRRGSHLCVPERRNDRWIEVDPEHLVRLVQERQREWAYFDQVVRMIKVWAKHQGLNIRPLALEVLVLEYLPRPRLFETLPRDEAIARFFEAAARADVTDLRDPAGRSGSIDPNIDYGKLRDKVREGAALSRRAVNAARAPVAAQDAEGGPGWLWHKLFGRKFPLHDLAYPATPPPPATDKVGWSWAVWWTRLDPFWAWRGRTPITPDPLEPTEDDPFRAPWDPPGSSPPRGPRVPSDKPPGQPPSEDVVPQPDSHPPPGHPLLFG